MILATFSLCAAFTFGTPTQEPEALSKLSQLVQSLVDADEIIGG
ncbi:MAG: hypothetical protein O3A20_03455 [Planctomycetota bacterium]|nr:hypothetical protein [Planctomycetota bacterium]